MFGLTRRLSATNYWRIEHLIDRLTLIPGDLLDQLSLIRVLERVRPQEVYNLAAMSFVPASWDQPMLTGEFNSQGVTRVLEAVRVVDPTIRLYQASSSEMYGKVREVPQRETTPFHPRSPYGVSKVFAHYITVNYRESYGMYAVSGILFNHESPRRGLEFVTRKVTDGVARIKTGKAKELGLGNRDAHRDWGFAGDYVRAMWMMLQQEVADDYVIATGEAHSVQELVEIAFGHAGLDWQKIRQGRPGLSPSGGSRSPDRRRLESPDAAGLETHRRLQRPRAHDGRRRFGKARVGQRPVFLPFAFCLLPSLSPSLPRAGRRAGSPSPGCLRRRLPAARCRRRCRGRLTSG